MPLKGKTLTKDELKSFIDSHLDSGLSFFQAEFCHSCAIPLHSLDKSSCSNCGAPLDSSSLRPMFVLLLWDDANTMSKVTFEEDIE